MWHICELDRYLKDTGYCYINSRTKCISISSINEMSVLHNTEKQYREMCSRCVKRTET